MPVMRIHLSQIHYVTDVPTMMLHMNQLVSSVSKEQAKIDRLENVLATPDTSTTALVNANLARIAAALFATPMNLTSKRASIVYNVLILLNHRTPSQTSVSVSTGSTRRATQDLVCRS